MDLGARTDEVPAVNPGSDVVAFAAEIADD
jgi:hypothetical protein